MPSTIVVPEGLSYVAAAVLSTAFVTFWQAIVVGSARKNSGIKYPQLYAEKAEAQASKAAMVFNCTQRAHQNTLEYLPGVLSTTLITAVQFPLVAAAGCGIWSFSRVLYTWGYATGNPDNRNARGGVLGYVGLFTLYSGASYTVYNLIMAGV